MLSKDALRKQLRHIRQDARKSVDFWGECPPSALAAFQTLLAARPIVGGYQPVGSEADPAPLLEIAAAHGCATALPFIATRAAAMEFRRWKPGEMLEKGVFGFEQPVPSGQPAVPDVLIIPLLGFDAAMNRLGQGAGHYDRYFSINHNSLRLGISYVSQQRDALPVDHWDVPLDAVLTEKGWITGPASRITLT
jgi:5-formyltetrahydrofolate cyclo-ligase